jgi:hypothetical protein
MGVSANTTHQDPDFPAELQQRPAWTGGPTVAILCSGFGLGFYIPGLLISRKLRQLGMTTEVEVFESLMPEDKLAMVERNRRAYHANFQVALASQKIPMDIRDSLSSEAVAATLEKWCRLDCRAFICLSGHWVPVLDRYWAVRPDIPRQTDLLYLDASLAPSWRQLASLRSDYASPYREIGLYDSAHSQVRFSIAVGNEGPLPYASRAPRLVAHGGGWGIGTFQEQLTELEVKGYNLDVACYGIQQDHEAVSGRRYFLDDPIWRTWHRNEQGEHTFPPFAEWPTDSTVSKFVTPTDCHGMHHVVRAAKAIISKPGAGTLIDSFAAATPLVLLEPFGPHEASNGRVWESKGFGIRFEDWAAAGYPPEVLEQLHHNLLAERNRAQDYAAHFAKPLMQIDPQERGTCQPS